MGADFILLLYFLDCPPTTTTNPLRGQQPEARTVNQLATCQQSLNGFIPEPMGGWMDEWVDFKQEGRTSCSESTKASEVVTHYHCVCSGATNKKNTGSLAVDEQEREVDSKAAAILLSHKSFSG